MERSKGWKIGGIFVLLGFLYLSQTSFKDLIPVISLDTYIQGFVMPTEIGPVPLLLIAWILFVVGILFIILATFDIPPFNY